MGSLCLATADICDTNAQLFTTGDLRILPPIFKIYGKCSVFSGPIFTFKVFEHNAGLRELLETRGEGRVLFIDGEGSMGTAVIGGVLTQLAHTTGWAGIVAYGCIRDVDEINGCDIGVRALASCPRMPAKTGVTKKHVTINVAGIVVHDGEWLYADNDDEINGCDIGVRALASHPQKSNKKGAGEKFISIHVAGTVIHDGEWLYADSDGILIIKDD